MALYTKAINIWSLTSLQRSKLQPGQWVYAGNPSDKGIWLGVKPSGTEVVAWHGNARSHASYKAYVRSLRDYALSRPSSFLSSRRSMQSCAN